MPVSIDYFRVAAKAMSEELETGSQMSFKDFLGKMNDPKAQDLVVMIKRCAAA